VTGSTGRDRLDIGIDIGGTKIRAVALDGGGAVVGSVRAPTTTGAAALVAAAESTVREVVVEAGGTVRDIGVVGAGIAGLVDAGAGTVTHAVNLGLGEEPFALGPRLGDRLGLPVHVENDVNAAALGAAQVLSASSVLPPDLAYVSIGTGLAAGLVLDGRLRRGSRGVAGEIGHIPIDPNGPRCECGRRGCLEVLASGSAIARRWPVDGQRSPVAELLAAAARGHEGAVAIRDEVMGHLADAIVMLALAVDPKIFVLGGGVAEVGEPLLLAVRSGLRQRASASPMLRSLDLSSRVTLIPPAPIGAIGAALAAHPEAGGEVELEAGA